MVLSGLAYHQFPELGRQQELHLLEGANDANGTALETAPPAVHDWIKVHRIPARLYSAVEVFVHDLLEFSRLPVFWSTCSSILSFPRMMLMPGSHP
jgi:hypothetical protein